MVAIADEVKENNESESKKSSMEKSPKDITFGATTCVKDDGKEENN